MKLYSTWSRTRVGVSSFAVMLLASGPVAAQSPTAAHQAGNASDYTATWVGASAGQVADFNVIAIPGSDAIVKGAPYSAEAVSEMVQTLGDGTRIVRESTSAVFRDSAGRTRREHGLTVIGPLAASPDADDRIVTINDPEAGVSYMLNSRMRTARKMGTRRLVVSGASQGGQSGGSERTRTLQVEAQSATASPEGPHVANRTARTHLEVPDSATESLGTQFIEGVVTEGSRTTMTIPTGQIGNDRPIQIVSERWYSPDLQVLVMSRQSDPRSGETTYRLTNIVRSEPAASLFEVPSNFEVIEGPGSGAVYRQLRVR